MPGTMTNFSPALVSWYSGPGWIGWTPQGMMGPAGQRIVTSVPGGTIQNGLLINPQNVNHLPVTSGTAITHLPFPPEAGAMLSGPRLSADMEALFTPHAGAAHITAPNSILMGGSPEKEQSLQSGRFTHQPLRVRSGTTLGGQYAVGGAVGEFRGDAFSGGHPGNPGSEVSHVTTASGPVILPHGQQSSNTPHAGGGAMAPSEGVGLGSSAPATTMGPASSGHMGGASSGGGHH
jgi:hypothetical protein